MGTESLTDKTRECPECRGTGLISADNCSKCGGSGQIIVHSHEHRHGDTVHDHPHPHSEPHDPGDDTEHEHTHR